MNCIILASFCCLVCSVCTLVLCKPANPITAHHRSARDLFVTTGWGGAGLPYSTFYITGKQMKEIRSENNGESKNKITEQNPEIISLVQCLDCGVKITKANEKKKTGRQTVPQLFSSNGWGPLGRRR